MSMKDDHPDQGWSAALDGEEDPQALRFMLKRAQNDADLAQRWSRWSLAGDLLARRQVAPAPSGFADAVAEMIAAEPSPVSTPAATHSGARRWMGGALGLAIAASVAWAALTLFVAPPSDRVDSPLVQNGALQAPPAMTPVASGPAMGLSPVQPVSIQSGATPVSYVPFRGRDAYMVRHSLGAQLAPLGVSSAAVFLAEPTVALPSATEAEAAANGAR